MNNNNSAINLFWKLLGKKMAIEGTDIKEVKHLEGTNIFRLIISGWLEQKDSQVSMNNSGFDKE